MSPRLALVLALASTSACVLLEEPEPEPTEQERHDLTEYAEQVDDKLRMYAGCRDALAAVVMESWERYDDQVEVGGKPTRRGEGVFVRGVTDNSFRGCRRTLANAARFAPDLPKVHQITSNLLGAAEQYAAQTRAVERWLARREPGDEWAELGELDGRVRAAHRRWADADAALTDAIDARHLENDPVLLGVLEGRRSSLELDTRKLMVRARPLVRCLTVAHEQGPLDTCQASFDAFDAAYAQFAATWAADRERADRVFWMRTFAADAADFHALVVAHQAKHRRDRAPKGEDEALVDAHAGLARDFDTLDFDFP
jgi:hypothetical protein